VHAKNWQWILRKNILAPEGAIQKINLTNFEDIVPKLIKS
jgi:hypothetical protein